MLLLLQTIPPNLFPSRTTMAMIPSLLLSFLSLFVTLRSAASDSLSFTYHQCVSTRGNMTSTYQNNRDNVLDKLSSNKEINNGFYNLSFGQSPDRAYALGLCRGDVKPDDCRGCLEKSATLLTARCPYQKEAIGWYDECMLRYSNTSIIGVLVNSPDVVQCNQNTTHVAQFNQVVDDLLRGLKSTVNASGDSRLKFAEGNATVPSSNDTLHALLQCRPDLSNQNCSQCLDGAFSRIKSFCLGKRGGRYAGPSCSARYETYVFFGPVAEAPQPEPPANVTISEGKSDTSRTVIAIVVPVVALVVLLILACIYLRVRKAGKHIGSEGEGEAANEIKNTDLLQFDLENIKVATQDFSDEMKLGEGGFGIVYKARLSTRLSSEQDVAIKRLSMKSGQEDTEFKNEVLLTAKLLHRNLVRLLGFCLERRERLLIYEFVSNKSLDYFIFDPKMRGKLDWETRYKIISGIARGLHYLHEESGFQIVHRDLKTSNILLDEELNPKISDFGLARLFDNNQTKSNTKTVVGTYGYMAPEYIKHGQFSIKSDVFSFGVMVLEIVCGRKNTGIQNEENIEDLLSIAWKNRKEETASNIVDPTLDPRSMDEIMICIKIGLHCVQENIEDRPTMGSIVRMLDTKNVSLPDPPEPAFFSRGKSLSATPSGEQNPKATTSSDSGSQSVEGSNYRPPISDICPR